MSTDNQTEPEKQRAAGGESVPGVAFVVPIETFRLDSVAAAIGYSNEVDIRGTHTRLMAAAQSARELDDPVGCLA